MDEMKPGRFRRWAKGALAISGAVVLSACGGGGGGGAPSGQGTLSVALTDAPSCYERVYVTVASVQVHRSDTADEKDAGWEELPVEPPRRIDLLTLTNGVMEELGTTQVPAGRYSQVRLVLAPNSAADPLANAVQPVGGTLQALSTPSAQQSGLKLPMNVQVQDGETLALLLDFDACKSVVRAGRSGQYVLKPVLSVAPLATASIQGYVTSTLAISGTSVSAQQDGRVVRATAPDAQGKFVLGFLPEGTYTVVITAPGRATGIVTEVPVSAGPTMVSGTATTIVLPSSPMGTVTGTLTASTGSGTATVAVTDATVSALQDVGGIPVEVASRAVDVELGTYGLQLPAAAPVRAAHAGGKLVFAPEAAAAGHYRLRASTPGRENREQKVEVKGDAAITADFGW